MMSELVYLAAPYSDPDPAVVETRMRMFLEVDAVLLREGKFTVSPLAKHFGLLVSKLPSDWAFWQHYSRAMIDQCGAMVVIKIDGWQESVGVQEEIQYAREKGIFIYYVDTTGQYTTYGGVR